jgi:hypothetical protein
MEAGNRGAILVEFDVSHPEGSPAHHPYPGGAIGRRTLLRRELLKVQILPGAPLTQCDTLCIIAIYNEEKS